MFLNQEVMKNNKIQQNKKKNKTMRKKGKVMKT